jgi:acyl-ACP thioesterase
VCGEPLKITDKAVSDQPIIYQTKYSDLDMVRHVNNVKYLEWILDTYDGKQEQLMPALLEVNYLHETRFRDQVSIFTQLIDDRQYLHRIVLSNLATEVLRARLSWRPV